MHRMFRLLTIGLAMGAGCNAGLVVGGAGPPDDVPDGSKEVRFASTDEDLLNPERGLFTIGDLVSGHDFAGDRAMGSTVSYVLVRLDAWRATALPPELLARLGQGFGLARAAGVKILLRFAYNFESGGADAPREVILGHLTQLAPVLHANADVIAAVQAGLIGAWGEWHHSTNDLDNPADRKAIVDALLAVVPPSRAVLLRTPMHKDENWPGPVTGADAFSGTAPGRIGHHNDCFLASDTDLGTYARPIEDWKRYVASDGRYVPVAGETCKLAPPRSACANAVREMGELHWSLMSRGGSEEVWRSWRDDGCDGEIALRLGYRFRLVRSILSEAVAPGGVLALTVQLENDGFASPYNPRPLFAVIEGAGRRLTARLDVDPRRWGPGEDTRFTARLRVPADLAAGEYRVALWLPDGEPSLYGRPEYAIRFANHDVWDASSGTNAIGTMVVDPLAPGPIDASATDLAALP